MNFGYTPESFPLLLLLIFGAIFAFVILFQLARLVLRLLGVRNNFYVYCLFFGGAALLLLGLSVGLDLFGERSAARVTTRTETVTVRRDGGWRHNFTLGLQFSAAGIALPPGMTGNSAMIEAFLKDRGAQFTSLSPSVATFDRVREGDAFEVRVFRVGGLSLVRDAGQSTLTLLPWGWIFLGALAVAAVVYSWKKIGLWIVLVVALIGITMPIVNARRDQRAADNANDRTERATATVHEVRRVKEWDFARSNRGSRWGDFEVAVPYDVVELQFTPRGYPGPVLGVDAIDVPANAPPSLSKGATVQIRYAPGNPRDAQIDGRARTWHWRNMVGVYGELALTIGIIVLLLALLGIYSSRKRRLNR